MDSVIVIVLCVMMLAVLVFAGMVVWIVLAHSRAIADAIVALKLSGGDSREYREVISKTEEPEEPVAQTKPTPPEPIPVGQYNDEVAEIISQGGTVDEALGMGWRTR